MAHTRAKALIYIILASLSAFAEDTAVEKKVMEAFAADHKDFKSQITNFTVMKKIGKLYESYYTEKNSYAPSKEELDAGFTIYKRPYTENVFPNMVPVKEQVVSKISCFAAPGEFEPLYFIVYPYRPLVDLKASVSDFRDASGNSIKHDSFDIRYETYEYIKLESSWMVEGRYLVHGPVVALSERPRPVWITVHVPGNAKPGTYKGTITLFQGKNKIADLDTSVEVLPFRLSEFDDVYSWWMFYYNDSSGNPLLLEKIVSDLKDHGMNTFDSFFHFDWKAGQEKSTIDFKFSDILVPLLKKYGFKRWMIDTKIHHELAVSSGLKLWSPEFNKMYLDFLKQLKDRSVKEKWPELVLEYDEPREDREADNSRGYIDIENALKLAKEAGIKTSVNWGAWNGGGFNRKDKDEPPDYTELCQLATYNTTHGNYEPSYKIIQKTHSLKKPLLLYNSGANRFAFGLLTWQNRAVGNAKFWYLGAKYGDGSSEYASSSAAVNSPEGPMPTVNFEWIREGIDDYRYIYTLEKELEKHKADEPAAKKGRTLLDEADSIKVLPGEGSFKDDDFTAKAMKSFDNSKLDELRRKIADCITELKR